MIPYCEIFNAVQDELGQLGDYPASVRAYHSYGNGKFLGTFDSADKASSVPGTKFVGVVITNRDEIDAWESHGASLMRVAKERWLVTLRKEVLLLE